MANNNRQALGILGGVAVILVCLVIIFISNRDHSPVKETASTIPPTAIARPGIATPPKEPMPPPKPAQIVAKEIRYLPNDVQLVEAKSNALLKMPNMKDGNRRITGIHKVSDKSRNGELLSPKWSADGLQMLVTRPGYRGLYVLDVRTGQMKSVSDGSGYGAKWTPDGKIEVRDEDGNIKTISPDGTVESSGAQKESEQVYAENDTVFVRGADGSVIPITTSDDKYFNPVTSPDGKSVIYQGLTSGLYMANADGSGDPVYIGRGNNAVWAPDSSGVIFDVTTDDGHNLTSGDIYYVDKGASERTNLTPGTDSIDEMPSVSPDGHEVAFQSDGEVYVGEMH